MTIDELINYRDHTSNEYKKNIQIIPHNPSVEHLKLFITILAYSINISTYQQSCSYPLGRDLISRTLINWQTLDPDVVTEATKSFLP